MRNIFAVLKNDFRLARRDFMIGYMVVGPFLYAAILAILIPSAQNSALPTFAVTDSVKTEVVQELDKYGTVLEYNDIEDLEKRVLANDDVIGLTMDGNEYKIITEGNESSNVLPYILNSYENNIELPIDIKFSDVGYEVSAMELYGIPTVILMTVFFAGIMIGFTIIEDKSTDAIDALSVSTITKPQYMLGKCMLPLIVALVDLAIIMAYFKVSANPGQVIVFSLVSGVIGALVGYVIGVTSKDQMGAITLVKIMVMIVIFSAIGGLLLPGNWKMLMYWSPSYWAFEGMLEITSLQATWGSVAKYSALVVGLTAVIFMAFRSKLKNTTRLI